MRVTWGRMREDSPGPLAPGRGERADPPPPKDSGAGKPTAAVFLSLLAGQGFNLVALSLVSAQLGLAGFGRFGICMLDFGVFASAANFALSAASVPMVIRGRFRNRHFAVAMGARVWTSLAAVALYLGFEAVFRDRQLLLAAAALAPALFLNPSQWDWWFSARQAWREVLVHRVVGGAATLGCVWAGWRLGVPRDLQLPFAAAAYSFGFMAAGLYLVARIFTASGGDSRGAGSGRPDRPGERLPRPFPVDRRMRWLWRKSFPISLATTFEFLFLPLGFYAFKAFTDPGPFMGAYGSAYRIVQAAAMLASSVFTVMLPRFIGRRDAGRELRALSDRTALALPWAMLAVPFLARPVLVLFFPRADWDAGTLAFAAWALSTMALSTYLHLLRVPPITLAMARGETWAYCRRFFITGGVNAVVIGAGVLSGSLRLMPMLALAADFVFTAWWMALLYPEGGAARWGRLGVLAAWSAGYLAWAWYWA